jgi:hypothetical protein
MRGLIPLNLLIYWRYTPISILPILMLPWWGILNRELSMKVYA